MGETIRVKDLAVNAKYPDDKDLCIDDWDTCACVSREQVDFDAEKGFCDYEVVIQRYSDDKFFKFTYTQFGHEGSDILEQRAREVFEKTKTVTYYE